MLVSIGKKLKTYYKAKQKERMGRCLSPVRRIERVAPINGKRIVAMTFDDGPSKMNLKPKTSNKGLTTHLIDILSEFNATATFDVIGTTGDNYPDKKGKDSTPSWGGIKFDHYPEFNNDILGGAKNCPELINKIIEKGNEIANHGFRHVAFGPEKFIYGKRNHFNNLKEVIEDLNNLDRFIYELTNKKITLARPPHYLDKIPDGNTAYDAYRIMGYNYMAASYDGGGWLPSAKDYNNTVEQMIQPIKNTLLKDAEALNGAIIFQKDGCNMSRHTPIADALYKQLTILKEYGYKVVSVSELLKFSPFEDINIELECFEDVKKLAELGFCVSYKNNTFQKDKALTRGELAMMLTPPKYLRAGYTSLTGIEIGHLLEFEKYMESQSFKDIQVHNPYFIGISFLSYKGYTRFIKDNIYDYDKIVDEEFLYGILNSISNGIDFSYEIPNKNKMLKADIIPAIKLIYKDFF